MKNLVADGRRQFIYLAAAVPAWGACSSAMRANAMLIWGPSAQDAACETLAVEMTLPNIGCA